MNHCLFWPTWCRLENVKWSNSRQFNPNFKIKTQKTHKQQSMRPLTCYKYFCQIYLFLWIFEYYGQLGAPGLGCATSFLDKMNMIFRISIKKICYIHVLVIFWNSFPPLNIFVLAGTNCYKTERVSTKNLRYLEIRSVRSQSCHDIIEYHV